MSALQQWRLEFRLRSLGSNPPTGVIWSSGGITAQSVADASYYYVRLQSSSFPNEGHLYFAIPLTVKDVTVRMQRRASGVYEAHLWTNDLSNPTVASSYPANWNTLPMNARDFSGQIYVGSDLYHGLNLAGSLEFLRFYSTESTSNNAPLSTRPGGELYSYEFEGNLQDSSGNGRHLTSSSGVSYLATTTTTGTLYFKNGTRIHLMSGRPDWLADRNGNRIVFESTGDIFNRITRIIDPLGRTIDIQYDVATGTPGELETRIHYLGTTTRSIKIRQRDLSGLLRDGGTTTTIRLLFRGLTGDGNGANDEMFNPKLPAEIELPNGQTYQLRYNQYGELARVTLPTGGKFEYDWGDYSGASGGGNGGHYGDWFVCRRVAVRREYSSAGSVVRKVEFVSPAMNNLGNPFTTHEVEKDPLSDAVLRKTSHTFWGGPMSAVSVNLFGYPAWDDGKERITETRNGADVPLRKVEQHWRQRNPSTHLSEVPASNSRANDPRVIQVDTTLGAMTSKQTMDYSLDAHNNLTKRCDYDFGNANWTRCAHYVYETAAAYTAVPVHLRGLVKQERLEGNSDPANTSSFVEESRVSYTLDDYGNSSGSGLTTSCDAQTTNPQLVDRLGIIGKEPDRGKCFKVRGNVTREDRGVGGNVMATSQRQFDIAGNVVKVTHPQVRTGASSLGTPETLVSYNDNYTSSPAGATFAFPTSITHPGGLATSAQYHYGLGALAQFTDPNGKVTTYSYGTNDALDRLTQVAHPIGQTIFEYEVVNNKIRTKKSLDGSTFIESEKTFDGLGRDWKSVSLDSYQGANSQVTVETQYDALGRAYRVSNPTRGTPSEWTTTSFDALDRPLTVTAPDGAVTRMGYSNNETLTRDPAGKWMKRVTDGLGRLKEVVEDPNGTVDGFTNSGGLAYSTTYSYDARDNLKDVLQGGRNRAFTYDSLGRLLTAKSPELGAVGSADGTITYTYDPAGNLTSRVDPRAAQLDVHYDLRGRAKKKLYGGVATPEVVYCYDGETAGDCVGAPTGGIANLAGRLTRVKNSVSTTDFLAYDALGRVTSSKQETAGLAGEKVFTYAYNHVAMSSMTYPSGRTVSYQFDRAGRVKNATGVKGGVTTNYVTAIDYAAHGAVEEMALANGTRKERACYNNRLQMTGMIVGQAPAGNCGSATNTLFRIFNEYEDAPRPNNGNLLFQTVADSGSWLVRQEFTYDPLNRLKSAIEGAQATNGWKQTFDYDRWGNRWLDTIGTNSYGVNTTGVANNASWFTAKNRLALVGPDGGFDAAGNQVTSESFTLSYDAENRMVGSTSGTLGTQSYGYDGEGRRVKKTAGSLTTYYVYDAAGQLAAEYESGGTGPASPCTTCYVAGDHLGSTRALWDEAGLKARYDYHPFGEAVAADRNNRASLACAAGVATCYNGPSGVAQRFTGQLRDFETGLDYFHFRHFASSHGRFQSVDPDLAGAQMRDPQTWNGYSYTAGRPTTNVDPDGDVALPAAVVGGVVGGAVGGVMEAGRQFFDAKFVANGGFQWKRIGSAALGGIVAGAVAGGTLGVGAAAGLGVSSFEMIATNASANVLGGIVQREVNERYVDGPGDPKPTAGAEVGTVLADAVFGAAGAKFGGEVADIKIPLQGARQEISMARFAHGRSTRRPLAEATARLKWERLYNANAALSGAVGGVRTTVETFTFTVFWTSWLGLFRDKDYEAEVTIRYNLQK